MLCLYIYQRTESQRALRSSLSDDRKADARERVCRIGGVEDEEEEEEEEEGGGAGGGV